MAAKESLIVFSLLVALSCAQFSLDDLIGQVFNNNTSSQQVESTTQEPTTVTVSDPIRIGETGGYRSCGVDKECVPRHLCVDGAISTTGENFIDIRINDEVCSYSEICCDIPNKVRTFFRITFFYLKKKKVSKLLKALRRGVSKNYFNLRATTEC